MSITPNVIRVIQEESDPVTGLALGATPPSIRVGHALGIHAEKSVLSLFIIPNVIRVLLEGDEDCQGKRY